MTTRRTVLALGSNLGERRPTMLEAVRRIAELPTTELVAISEPIETVAVTADGEDPSAPPYLNLVVIVHTALAPGTLLDELNRIEAELGRVRAERWGNRTLDIDIVTMDGVVLDEDSLTLPHPRAHERRFVLEPWLSIDADAQLPGHGRVDDLLRRLGEPR